jgi:hypothetical protein
VYHEPEGPELWHFFEWSDGLAGGAWGEPLHGRLCAPWNLYLHEAIGSVAWMHEQAGRASDAAMLRRRQKALGVAIRDAFWDPRQKLFATYLHAGKLTHFAQLTQALALYAGIATAPQRAAVLSRLEDPAPVQITLSSLLFLIRALLALGPKQRRLACSLVSRHWDPMTFASATSYWETALGSEDFARAGSLCHGWSALPIYWYGAAVLGVRPIEPGFRRFVIDPFPDRFARFRGTVPTPAGSIRVEWERTPRGLVIDAHGPRELQPSLAKPPAASIARLLWNGKATRFARV